MTNHWRDIKNADVILVMGANPAENHPCGFKWAVEAQQGGAKLVVVDPRFNRTAAVADLYAPIRAGSDIAFLGGLINHTLQNNLHHQEYVRLHTNASFLVQEGFSFTDGLFSGFDDATATYDKASWRYETDEQGFARRDPTLQDPRSVFQILKAHYARYTPEVVADICGCSREEFLKVADVVCSTGRADRVGTIMYAVGWTQHTYGAQIIRTAAILQLLLGNIGRPGGGINALRGHANVQGATDHAVVANSLPGYLKMPTASQTSLEAHLAASTPKPLAPNAVNYWSNYPKFFVSQLKTWWGQAATPENDFAYAYLPKMDEGTNTTYLGMFDRMYEGKMEGLLCFGFNPVLAGPNTAKLIQALGRLKWLVVVDPFDNETASFWQAPGVNAADIQTEVFVLPSTHWIDRSGSFTNSGRLAQWKHQAMPIHPGIRSDTWILANLMLKLKELYRKEGGAFPDPIVDLTFDYLRPEDPSLEELAREINGYDLTTGRLLDSFAQMRDDGTTTSGNWLYCGSWTEAGNMMARRGQSDPTGMGFFHEWAWNWPLNRRVLYNRASADAGGRPWDPRRPGIVWNGSRWVGDVPDFGPTSPPSQGLGAFIMTEEGVGRLYSPGLADGPLSEHYEPFESPTENLLHPNVKTNPVTPVFKSDLDRWGNLDEYPIVCTTYRLTEHEHFVTAWVPYLVEAMPDFFVEIPEGLAQEKGIVNGGRVRVRSIRGEVEGVAMVTKRLRPLNLKGRRVWQVGMPLHWGFRGLMKGPMANSLTPFVGDPNTQCPEFKGFLVNVEKA
ncbi:formate dehydrogenase [Limnochorda pilosa]|nr:formate dehydrogenase [Limnochorda pilosa]